VELLEVVLIGIEPYASGPRGGGLGWSLAEELVEVR
jgi:hypothetical protein